MPVYFFRYEDLAMQQQQITTELFRFILDQPSIEGTVLEHRINKVTEQPIDQRNRYQLKSKLAYNRNVHLYTPE